MKQHERMKIGHGHIFENLANMIQMDKNTNTVLEEEITEMHIYIQKHHWKQRKSGFNVINIQSTRR